MEREFTADPATVFSFVTRSENLAKWWGPEGMTLPEKALDFSRKGLWLSVMMNADGKRYKCSGKVLSCDPPRSVEFTWAWHDEKDARGHESLVRFEVHAGRNGGSRFVLIHSGLPDEESVANHEIGWSSSLRKLERMAGLSKTGRK